MQTPISPVNFACPHAMNAAISSWRAWMNSGSPSGAVERAEEAVDPVAGIAVDAVDAPLAQALENEVDDELGHLRYLLVAARKKVDKSSWPEWETSTRWQQSLSPLTRRGPRRCVPYALLAIPAVALSLLLAAIFSNALWLIDFLHVAGGGMWTGIDLFMGFVQSGRSCDGSTRPCAAP